MRKDAPDIIFYKTSYEEEEMKAILVPQSRSRERHEPPKITATKKKDLLQLCSNLHIPKSYHFFYAQLQTTNCETANAE
ncbi:hypothetical protein PR048_004441, partial [Dryococelus australis]